MNKKGFTLIELLAVIIILGILMIIAIPSVTRYISDSRKSTYVDTASALVSGARNMVNEGKLQMFDTDTTYFINTECIKAEGASKSPYGEFVKAYVVVTYNGKGYDYYWTSIDEVGNGIKKITKLDKLNEDAIESDLTINDINDSAGIDGRNNYMIIDKTSGCNRGEIKSVNSKVNGETGEETIFVCKRATVLHSAQCRRSDDNGCRAMGYSYNETVKYGNLNTVAGVLTPGDAFDCDVNNDGVFNATNERFYYMTKSGSGSNEKAVLIYYSNVSGGTPSNMTKAAYDLSGTNINGPIDAYNQLPSKSQWSNPGIILPGSRQITTETSTTSTPDGNIEMFNYNNKAARLATYQDFAAACGNSSLHSIGSLNNCFYTMENTQFISNINGEQLHGYWLETPSKNHKNVSWHLASYVRELYAGSAFLNDTVSWGVRPVIEVFTFDINY